MGIKWYKEPTIISLLLGGFPLKNMSSSVGMIIPIYGKINMFQTTNQYIIWGNNFRTILKPTIWYIGVFGNGTTSEAPPPLFSDHFGIGSPMIPVMHYILYFREMTINLQDILGCSIVLTHAHAQKKTSLITYDYLKQIFIISHPCLQWLDQILGSSGLTNRWKTMNPPLWSEASPSNMLLFLLPSLKSSYDKHKAPEKAWSGSSGFECGPKSAPSSCSSCFSNSIILARLGKDTKRYHMSISLQKKLSLPCQHQKAEHHRYSLHLAHTSIWSWRLLIALCGSWLSTSTTPARTAKSWTES